MPEYQPVFIYNISCKAPPMQFPWVDYLGMHLLDDTCPPLTHRPPIDYLPNSWVDLAYFGSSHLQDCYSL